MKILNLLLPALPVISTLFLFAFLSSDAFSQNHSSLGLPEGAKARFGKGKIYQLKFFPDGKRLAVATSIGIWIYDVQTGEPLDLLTGHTGPVTSIVFSPDGNTFATVSTDYTIRIWDASTGEHKVTCIGHEYDVKLIAFNPVGDRLASVDDDESTRFWDVQTGKPLKTTIKSAITPTYSLAYSPDSVFFFTIGYSDKNISYIEYWDAQTGDHKKNVLIDTDFKIAMMSPDCKILACGNENPLGFYDAETGKHLKSYSEWGGEFQSMEFSPDGRSLVTGSSWNKVDIWEVGTAKLLKSLTHKDEVLSVTYSPDGKTIASGSDDGTVRIWEATTGDLRQTISGHLSSEIYSAANSPDGHTLLCGSEGKIYTWDARSGELLKTSTEPNSEVYSIKYSPDGKLISTAGASARSHITSSHKARLWDVQTGRFLGGFMGYFFSIAFSPDGNILATGGGNGQVCLWEIRTGELYLIGERLAAFNEHTDSVSSVDFSPDGKVLASGSQDKKIQLWDVNTRTHLKTLTGHEKGVTAVVYAFYGSALASGSEDGTIRLWNALSGDLLLPPIEGAGRVTSLAYSPEGTILASGSETNNAINIWDAQTGKLIHTFTGHTQRVNAVVFSSDGKTLASVSSDGTVLIWDIENANSK